MHVSVKSWGMVWNVRARTNGAGRRRERGRQGARFVARLTGFEEVPPILTGAAGRFAARLVEDGSALEYELSYTNLSSPATAAHLHFGQPGVNGEIFVFLCGQQGGPACSGQSATITGMITARDILAIPDQGLEAGDLEGALEIMRRGLAYVNVHSEEFPRGEIRGQVRAD